MKLRWLRYSLGSPIDAMAHHKTSQMANDGRSGLVLQMWVDNPRIGELGGIDYSKDGKWIDVPPAEAHGPRGACGLD